MGLAPVGLYTGVPQGGGPPLPSWRSRHQGDRLPDQHRARHASQVGTADRNRRGHRRGPHGRRARRARPRVLGRGQVQPWG